MRISELCIKRPVFAIVLNLLLIIIGYIGFDRLSVRELPKTEQFTVQVSTTYRGASAELVESEITLPIENAIAGVEGIESIASTSSMGSSSVVINFMPNFNASEGMNDLRDQLSRVRRGLPEEADEPVLIKADPNTEPTLYISFSDKRRDALAVTDYVERYIRPELQQVEGVGNAHIFGAQRYAVRIWPDPLDMAARGVTVNDISDALYEQNTALPSGEIKSNYRNFTVTPHTRLENIDEFRSLIIRDDAGKLVRMADIAKVELGPRNTDSSVHVNGTNAIVIAIIPQSTANPVAVSEMVKKRLATFQSTLPEGMKAEVVFDNATFIEASIHEVYKTIFEAVVLVVLVMLAFLGSMRTTIIPIITIPLCLMATFGLIYFLGYTINTMTLLAMVLAIGLVVDDAIVMLENIYRHMEKGMSAFDAAIKGSSEITFAIIAMTITLAAVYAPIGFTEGFTGDIFREFAFTLAGAVVVSGFVALTLSPMMCAYVLKPVSAENTYTQKLENFFHTLNNKYHHFLAASLRHRKRVVLLFLVLGGLGGGLFMSLDTELAPIEDTGVIIAVASAPTGSSFRYMEAQIQKLENIMMQVPERNNLVAITGTQGNSSGMAFLTLKDWSDRSRSQTEILGTVLPPLFKIPGARFFAFELPPIDGGGSGTTPIDMVVQMSGTYAELYSVIDQLKEAMEKSGDFVSVQSDLKMDSQQIEISFDRELAANLGINIADIYDALSILFAGRAITDYEAAGENYDVVVQMAEDLRTDPERLNDVFVRAPGSKMVPLGSLIRIESVVKPEALGHYNRLRAAHLTANLSPGISVGEGIEKVDQLAQHVIPVNAKTVWTGFSKSFIESSGAMQVTIGLALIFIYLVLAAQFESFRDPFIIMLTVPFSIIGAALLLKLTGGTNNIYTQIGFVTLIGLITKHGILIVEFANHLRQQGLDKFEAVTQAAVTRLRPILMTTGSMILGALPLAFASGAGAVSRSQMGWVIVGGMLFGTIFSLLVVPIAYSFIGKSAD